MLILRVKKPDMSRGFKTPLAWVIGPISIAGCLYLLVSLPQKTLLWFIIWNIVGFAVYFLYSRRSASKQDSV